MTAPTRSLCVRNLEVSFQTPGGTVKAVRGVTFDIPAGENVGILGESGSGKSVSVGAALGTVESPPAIITGSARLGEVELIGADRRALRKIQGDRIAMVFQDAMSALNPGLTVGYQLEELFRVHRPTMKKAERRAKTIDLLRRVQIPSPEVRITNYPHEFSGGMCQRIMIAMAIALEPEVLIADEPTTALDVTVEAQIMRLLSELKQQTGMALVLITHDIGLVAENTAQLLVMYGGQIVERGATADIIARPAHPYTIGLMNSVPSANMKGKALNTIPGSPPVLAAMPSGCVFHPRCVRSTEICRTDIPQNVTLPGGRESACHFAKDIYDA